MRRRNNQACVRYGVDIRGPRRHAEAHDLNQVLAALEGTLGKAQVIDRKNGRVAFAGTVEEVREAVNASAARDALWPCGPEPEINL